MIKQTIRENAATPLKQDEYTWRFNARHDRQIVLWDRFTKSSAALRAQQHARDEPLYLCNTPRAKDILTIDVEPCMLHL